MRRARSYQRHDLPVQRTRLVGREHELAAVRQALLRADGRLVTLTGAGGCGKTRLALAVAFDLLDSFADGVWLVELASLIGPKLVPQAVATTLGVREQPARLMLDTLVARLRTRQLLLVLDNCEHLVEACARLVDALLAGCPDLRLLATSREPLGIQGEITWRVPPLAVPSVEQLSTPGELARSAAVQLFVDRAQAAQPAFALTAENAPSIGQICRWLEGLPLGIELAAARLRALGVDQILQRLDTSLRVLVGSSRTAPDRQRTLKAALDWSHALLTPREQVLFRRLAVFAGGWSLEAAEAVCAGDEVEDAEVLELLSRLVDKSLVVMEEEHDRRARYRLLEPIRQYALERLLACGELEPVRRQHAAFFASVAADCDIVGGPRRQAVYDVLEREQDNMRAALRWCVEHGETEMGFRIASGHRNFWMIRSRFSEGRAWLDQLARLPQAQGMPALQAKLLCIALPLARRQADYAAAQAVTEVLPLLRHAEEPWWLCRALNDLGIVALYRGEYGSAEAYFVEALAAARAAGDRVNEAGALNNLGWLACVQADYPAAHARTEEGLAVARGLGDSWLVSVALTILGLTLLQQGDLPASRRLYDEALMLRRQIGDAEGLARTLNGAGVLAAMERRYEEAWSVLSESLRLRHELGDRAGVAESLEGLAALAAAEGRADRALHLEGAAEGLRTAIGARLSPSGCAMLEAWLAPVRRVRGRAAVAQALAAGRAASLDDVLSLALAGVHAASAAPDHERPHTLTPREREVVGLIGKGLTNRQIAEALVVSERTAEWHAAHILDKLGMTTRSQVAAWAVQHCGSQQTRT
jgi:predicted ATPase/DNA-binding CsgD family transcriptional regulator